MDRISCGKQNGGPAPIKPSAQSWALKRREELENHSENLKQLTEKKQKDEYLKTLDINMRSALIALSSQLDKYKVIDENGIIDYVFFKPFHYLH